MAGSGQLEFEEFVTLAAQFLGEEEEVDAEAMQAELKEAFRLYDKEGKIVMFFIFIREQVKTQLLLDKGQMPLQVSRDKVTNSVRES